MTHLETEPAFDNYAAPPGGETSSIGAVGEPQPSTFGRLKGFYGHLVDSNLRLREAREQFFDAVEKAGRGEEFTRVQHRVIFEGDLLREQSMTLVPWVEAVVPLQEGALGNEPVLVYMAANAATRQPHGDDETRIAENLRHISLIRPRSRQEILERSQIRGYGIDILSVSDRRDEAVQDQMGTLYARFGWNREQVGEMLQNPQIILAVARTQEGIVSAGIGELAAIPIGNTVLRLAELTEAATLEDHERNGCYSAISTTILTELQRRSRLQDIFGGEIDLAFGESNGLSVGVLRVAAVQGRRFTTDSGHGYGFPDSGILRQQVPIEGTYRRTPYNDLVVTYLTRGDIYAIE